jgi:tetratricopeptide (TPR) repeat protein
VPLPFLGALFRSSLYQKRETELVILVTPRLVKPMSGDSFPLPTDHFVEPSALEFYFFGALEGLGSYTHDDEEEAAAKAAEKEAAAKAAEEQAAARAAEEQAAAQTAEEEAAAQVAEEEAAAQVAEEEAAAQAAEQEAADEVAEQEAPAQVAEEEAAAQAAATEEGVADASTGEASAEHEALAAAGDLAGAIATLAPLIASDPDDMSHHLRMVEYAFRLNDPSGLSNAYLGLAECLERSGQSDRAAGVFQQVLSTDPANERARQALGLPEEDEAPTEAPSKGPSEAPSDDSYIDVGEMLLGGTAEEFTEKSTRFVVPYEEPTGDDQADFERMLSQFREKVAENIDPNDAMAHYDLGTAYMEMGLLDEAISEFQMSLRGAPDHLPAYEMLGQTFMQKEEPEAALRSLTRALETPYEVEDELVAIYYYLGLAYETVGNKDSALEYYDRVFALDINFADVTQRLKSLRGVVGVGCNLRSMRTSNLAVF